MPRPLFARLLPLLLASGLTATAEDPTVLLTAGLPTTAATQGSYYLASKPSESRFGLAYMALTGERANFAFHTKFDQGAWWAVDLGGPCTVERIRIVNRTDQSKERANSLEVYVSQSPFTSDENSWLQATKVLPRANAFETLEFTIPLDKQAPKKESTGMSFGGMDMGMGGMTDVAPGWQYVGLRLTEQTALHLKKVEVYGKRIKAEIPTKGFE